MYKWKHRFKTLLPIAAGYLLIFLVGKLCSHNPGLSLWQWLLDTDSRNYPYLFGWLIHHKRFLYVSLISMCAALLGKERLAWISLLGFALGLLLGEFLGASPAGGLHYGWAIWGMVFFLSCVMGAVLQRFPKYSLTLHAPGFRLWLAVYLVLFACIMLFVRCHIL